MVLALIKSAFGGAKTSGLNRRAFPRHEEARAILVVDGVSYPLVDWNPRGFQIAPYAGRLKVNDTIKVGMIIPHRGRSHGFDLQGQVKRLDSKNLAIGGVFIDVDSTTTEKLKKLFAARPHRSGPVHENGGRWGRRFPLLV